MSVRDQNRRELRSSRARGFHECRDVRCVVDPRVDLGGLVEPRAGVFVLVGAQAGEAVVAKLGGVGLASGALVEVREEGMTEEVAPEEVGERGEEKSEGDHEKGDTEPRHG